MTEKESINFKNEENSLSKVLPHLRNHRCADVSSWNSPSFYWNLNIQIPPKLSLSLMGFGVIAVLMGAYNLKFKSLLANQITNQKPQD